MIAAATDIGRMPLVLLRNIVLFISLIAVSHVAAIEVNPGFPESIHTDTKEPESPVRRSEVIFFISYPFTFIMSFAAYGAFGYGMSAIDGKTFAPDGAFYGLAAVTAAFLSFGIAMDDYYAIKAQTKSTDGKTVGYLSLSYRF